MHAYIKGRQVKIHKFVYKTQKEIHSENIGICISVKENKEYLSLAQKHGVNYILIDDKYEVDL